MSVFYFIYNLTYAGIVVGCAYLAYQRKNKQYKQQQKILAAVYYAALLLSAFLDPLDTFISNIVPSKRAVYLVTCIYDFFYYTVPSSVVLMNIVLAVHMYHMTLPCKFHLALAFVSVCVYAALFTAADATCFFFYSESNTCQILSRAPQYTLAQFLHSLSMQLLKMLPLVVCLCVLCCITKISVVNYYEVEHENQYLKMRENELYVKWQQNQLRATVYLKVTSNLIELFYAYAVQMWGYGTAQAVLRYFIQSAAIFVDCYAYAIVLKRPRLVEQFSFAQTPPLDRAKASQVV